MKIFPFLSPMTGIGTVIIVGLVTQQTGVNISTELLISILVNVAIIALAFGKMQSNVGHIKETMDRIEKAITDDVTRIEKRVERVASRYHNIANELLGRKLMEDQDEQS